MIISSQWLKSATKQESIQFYVDLSLTLVDELHPADKCILVPLLERHDFVNLLACEAPLRGRLPYQIYIFNQILSFFKKNESLDLGIDCEAVAYDTWKQSELLCKETNDLFRNISLGRVSFSDPSVNAIFHGAQMKIASVLGDLPCLSNLKFRFGPGSTTTIKKKSANPLFKLSGGLVCSEDILPILPAVLREMPLLDSLYRDESSRLRLSLADDILEFVPKNAKTHRAITKTSMLNSMVQLAIGDFMAQRLRAFAGIDIRDQTLNQSLACDGSRTGSLATIDLSSASDTISIEIVYALLPVDWAIFLDMARVKHVSYKGARILQEKFCSMGNGFTFPLETLIFWALSEATVEWCELDAPTNLASQLFSECTRWVPKRKPGINSFVSVYGDDIIVPSRYYDKVSKVLHSAGFLVNHKKSFVSGVFRESCGKDYASGIDIRPVYGRKPISQADLFRLHNFFKRNGMDVQSNFVLGYIHETLRIYGPDGYGDGHLIGDWIPRHPKSFIKRGFAGAVFDTFVEVGRSVRTALLPGDYIFPAYSIYINDGERVLPECRLPSGFLRRGMRDMKYAPLAIDDYHHKSRDEWMKVLDLPGGSGMYKRVSIYTLSVK